MTKVTSVPAEFDQNEVSAFINKKTGQVIRVLRDVYAESPREEADTSFWTFNSKYPSPDTPIGYNGKKMSNSSKVSFDNSCFYQDDFDEALGHVLGFSRDDYEEQINLIRSNCRSVQEFSDKLHDLAAKKDIWLELVSDKGVKEPEFVFGGLNDCVVGFIWTDYNYIHECCRKPDEWKDFIDHELVDYSDYVNGRVYAIEYVGPEVEQLINDGEQYATCGNYFDFPDDPSAVLPFAYAYLAPFDDAALQKELNDWVPAKRKILAKHNTQVVYAD